MLVCKAKQSYKKNEQNDLLSVLLALLNKTELKL